MLKSTLYVLGFCMIAFLCFYKGLYDSDFDALMLGIATLLVPLVILIKVTVKSWNK